MQASICSPVHTQRTDSNEFLNQEKRFRLIGIKTKFATLPADSLSFLTRRGIIEAAIPKLPVLDAIDHIILTLDTAAETVRHGHSIGERAWQHLFEVSSAARLILEMVTMLDQLEIEGLQITESFGAYSFKSVSGPAGKSYPTIQEAIRGAFVALRVKTALN